MKAARSALALALGLGALGTGASAAAQQPRKPAAKPAPQEQPNPVRDGLEALEARLDRAVDRVSLPHAARLLGRAEVAHLRATRHVALQLQRHRSLQDAERSST